MGLRNTLAETYFTDDSFMSSLKFDFWQTFDLCSKVTHSLLPADVFKCIILKVQCVRFKYFYLQNLVTNVTSMHSFSMTAYLY